MLKLNFRGIVHMGKERKGGSGGFYNSTIKLKLEKLAWRVKEFVLETKEHEAFVSSLSALATHTYTQTTAHSSAAA